jgi:hypothetical protein
MADMFVTAIRTYDLSREEMVKCARAAIARTRRTHLFLTTTQVRRLMKIARTETEFSVDKWRIGSCGCLLGHLHGPTIDPEHLTPDEYWTGLYFNEELVHALVKAYGEDFHADANHGAIAKVVD